MLAIGTIMSCQKTETYNELDLLVDSEWQLKSITQNDEEIAEDCELDNTIKFDKNGSLVFNSGTKICEDESDFNEWKFDKDYSQIKMIAKVKGNGISKGKTVVKKELLTLTENWLILKEVYAESSQRMPRIYKYEKE